MKKTGTLNSELAKVLADLGHTDTICIADCGLPVPAHVKKIDLALTFGKPSFIDVLNEINTHMVYEKVELAEEIITENPLMLEHINQVIKETPKSFLSHESFKQKTQNCKAIIRTGEATPYANIILHAGVYFGK